MRRKILSSLLVTCCILLPTVAAAGTGAAPAHPFSTPSSDATGLIVSAPGAVPDESVHRVSGILGREVVGQSQMGGSWVSLRFDRPLPASSVRSHTAALDALPGMSHPTPDLVATSDSIPNDPYFPKQTNLWSPASVAPDYSIDAPTIWDATLGSKSVVVAVVDSGIVAHPDLANQTVPGYDLIADYRNANDGDGRDPNAADPGSVSNGTYCSAHPSSWHGSHVAGIIGAIGNNGIGISGIAPGVRLQPVRVMGQCGGSISDIIAGIRWASGGYVSGVPSNNTPADVINVSLSSTVSDNKCPQAYQDVVNEARSRGVVVVVSAGNQGTSFLTRTPANCAGVLSVGATDVDGSPTSYTNAGATIGMMAQGGEAGSGQGIWSTVDAGTAGPTQSTYGQKAGTSMAAPSVAAVAGLVFSLGNFTNDQVVQVLKKAAVPPPRLDGYYTCIDGSGRSVCGAGILSVTAIPAPVGRPVLVGGSTVGSRVWFTPGAWNGHPDTVTFQWLRNGAAISGATGTSYVLTRSDLGRTLTVRSTARTQGYPDFSSLSYPKSMPKR